MTDFAAIRRISEEDARILEIKGASYGDSWCRRGGMGAFMMLARKWDRIENQCEKVDYNIFKACHQDYDKTDGMLDDIRDLRRYLLLVEERVLNQAQGADAPKASVGQ